MEKGMVALGEQMERIGRRVDLVICGGTAINFLGIDDRLTSDVDVMGTLEEDNQGRRKVVEMRFEPWLVEVIRRVARDLGLHANWLNPGGAMELAYGLPEGIEDRLVTKEYGENLKAHYCSRIDLLFLKLNAAVDLGQKQESDVLAINPSEEEIEMAARWCLECTGRRVSAVRMEEYLGGLGYGEVAERVSRDG